MMRHLRVAAAFAALLAATGACAAQSADAQLNDTQKLGQRLFAQSCGVCHLKPQLGAPQYAPVLSRESLGGKEDVIRGVIANGTPRMPGFRFQFDQTQIAAIAAYLKTVPPQLAAAAPARPSRDNGRDAD
jgi:mono/diheme cytochrome c family protein